MILFPLAFILSSFVKISCKSVFLNKSFKSSRIQKNNIIKIYIMKKNRRSDSDVIEKGVIFSISRK